MAICHLPMLTKTFSVMACLKSVPCCPSTFRSDRAFWRRTMTSGVPCDSKKNARCAPPECGLGMKIAAAEVSCRSSMRLMNLRMGSWWNNFMGDKRVMVKILIPNGYFLKSSWSNQKIRRPNLQSSKRPERRRCRRGGLVFFGLEASQLEVFWWWSFLLVVLLTSSFSHPINGMIQEIWQPYFEAKQTTNQLCFCWVSKAASPIFQFRGCYGEAKGAWGESDLIHTVADGPSHWKCAPDRWVFKIPFLSKSWTSSRGSTTNVWTQHITKRNAFAVVPVPSAT